MSKAASKPTKGTLKNIYNASTCLKNSAIGTFETESSLAVEDETMHVDRKQHLMHAIANVANGRAREKSNIMLESRQDMLKLSFDPQNMNVTVDMLYYKISADDCTPDGEMAVKYAACL